jgi:predicted MPP superfamily phosphohydrolase
MTDTTDIPAVQPAATPLTRRQFFKQLAAYAALPVAAGAYAHWVEPFWPRYPEIPVKIAGLPQSFDGFRIAQLTDMHAGRAPLGYLTSVVNRVQSLKPDAVLVTGDMIHHTPFWIDPISRLLATLTMPVITSFGNHEFGVSRDPMEPKDSELAEQMQASLINHGIPVLRNKSMKIDHADGRLWFVGLDDLWFGHFDPVAAFDGVPKNEPVICLSHNPDTAPLLDPYHPRLILSGHTHGGQIRLPFYGAMRLNVANPQYDMGMFQLPNSQLYVSTGIGFIMRMRFNCRPEVPVFKLVAV